METLTSTYRIIKKLGEGSGGIVYLAYHTRLQKEVVLKQIKNTKKNIEKNRREVDILKNLKHSYLPQVLDFLEIEGCFYTVMSFIPGKSLQQVIDEGYTPTIQQLIRWGMQLSSALNYLHMQNPPIIHSDIKPSNIMLTPQGTICLIDFNISFFLDGTTMLGYTNGYSSPEQKALAKGERDKKIVLDNKTDIYSVGATLYYLATKTKALSPDFDFLKEKTNEAFASVIKICMAQEKKDRYDDAFAMFKAFQSIPKKDKRYRDLKHKHQFIYAILVVILTLSILSCGLGVHTMKKEKVRKYNDLVADQITYREQRNQQKEEEVFKKAIALLPSSIESYYQNALTLYEIGEYQKCLDFISYDILENEDLDLLQKKVVEVYNLKANCHFKLKDYTQAVQSYETLFKLGGRKYDYYRDYAIALAYDKQVAKAREKLQEAIDHGMSDDTIYFTKGEIAKSLEKDEEAVKDLKQCLSLTENTELMERSYILIGDIYEKNTALKEAYALWHEACEKLPAQKQLIIMERLIQTDINLAAQSNDSTYQKEAVSILEKIISNQWENYNTYDNLVILNEKLKNYEQAEIYLAKMVKLYGNDYNIQKRYAFLQIDYQEMLENQNRDYKLFESYYEQAKDLYSRRENQNDTDPEMELLETVHQMVVSGGWLS